MSDIIDLTTEIEKRRQKADDGELLGVIWIYKSSRVRSWVSDRVAAPEHVEWMHERCDDAKDCIRRPDDTTNRITGEEDED